MKKKKRIWVISDPHGKQGFLDIPEKVDMVICAGDIGTYRDPILNQAVVLEFLEWYNSLTHIPHKVLIAGNHDTSIEKKYIGKGVLGFDSITYLEHSEAEIDGIKIFGSPYTPSFGQGWAFNVARQKLDTYWKEIPEDTDILITHGPPKGILDLTECGGELTQCGCKALFNRVTKIQPKFHIFGHIHPEDNCPNAGKLQIQGCKTTFINAAVVNLRYEICNNGYIIEI